MSYYINKEIFNGAGREEGIWALIGTPIGLDGVTEIGGNESVADYCFTKEIVSNILESVQFKDICIAGLASTESGIVLADEGSGSVKIKYPQSSDSKILISVSDSEANSTGFDAAYLVYVSLKKDGEGKFKFYNEGGEHDLIERTLEIYEQLWNGNSNSLNDSYTNDSCKIFEEYFEEILLAYDLNTLNGSLVNGYNYTGFSVGSATISLSGLNSIF